MFTEHQEHREVVVEINETKDGESHVGPHGTRGAPALDITTGASFLAKGNETSG